ncbi:MAG: GlsB/YeaQ/YmgE family stress response membrane protein [Bryobacteraceae bacterium]
MTALLGIVGGWVGGQIGKWVGWYKDGHPAGFGLSVVGAMATLLVYRMLVH